MTEKSRQESEQEQIKFEEIKWAGNGAATQIQSDLIEQVRNQGIEKSAIIGDYYVGEDDAHQGEGKWLQAKIENGDEGIIIEWHEESKSAAAIPWRRTESAK